MARSSLTLSILQRSGKAALDGSCKRHSSILSSISTFDFKLSNQSSNQNCFHSVANNGSTTVYSHNVIQSRFSSSSPANKSYKLLIVGGGAGGCSMASKFASKLGKGNVAVIEPSEMHYYQPMWTLVGGGLKKMEQSGKPMGEVLPKNADWIKSSAAKFDPEKNTVTTTSGDAISYEYLLVAVGLQLQYEQIKGLPEALETPSVWSNYHPNYAPKGPQIIKAFNKGNAVFTFPKPPLKCPGAPQKIMYITERLLKEQGKRDQANIQYHTSLPVLFGVKKYADALWKVVEERNINVSLNSCLVEVHGDKKEAIFEDLQSKEKKTVPYEILHVAPPMTTPECLKLNAPGLVDAAGFVDVDAETMQHVKYKNVFAMGDCANLPTAKTGAAIASQVGLLKNNLNDVMNGKDISGNRKYDGYTSCPLVVGPSQCIMAEFDKKPEPLETFPINQGVPRWTMYNVKAHILPELYWQMLKGRWEGPRIFRKLFHLGMSK